MTTLVPGTTGTGDLPLPPLQAGDGRTLSGLRLRYRVAGNVAAAREHGWILVFHALTGSADVEQWWGPLVGPGRPLDTSRHAILTANLLGSCYGSTGPQEWAAKHDDPFPQLTPADLADAHIPLLEHLGVERIALATGGSLGGMVTLEWGRRSPVPVDRLVVFAAPAATSAQAIAWNTVQRMAIEADPAWQDGRYAAGQGPVAGLAAARALAMITYRTAVEFEARFGRTSSRTPGRFDVDHYLRRQGDKLVARFDARELRGADAGHGPARRGGPPRRRSGDGGAGRVSDRCGGGLGHSVCAVGGPRLDRSVSGGWGERAVPGDRVGRGARCVSHRMGSGGGDSAGTLTRIASPPSRMRRRSPSAMRRHPERSEGPSPRLRAAATFRDRRSRSLAALGMTAGLERASDVAVSTSELVSGMAALAAVLQVAAPMLQPVAPMLQAVAPALQVVSLPLPPLTLVLVASPLEPRAVPFPALSLPLHPISVPLQPLPPVLEPPAVMPVVPLVARMPPFGVLLGALHGKGVGWTDLRGQRRHRETQRGREAECRLKTYHAFLPRQGCAARGGVGWLGREDDDDVVRALSGPDGRPYARKLSSARARLTCRSRLSAFSLIWRTRSRVMPSRLPISSSVIGSGPSRPK